MIRVGIDTGGTFTDTVLTTPDATYTSKTPTSDDLISGITQGLDDVCAQATVNPADIDFFSHGHTVATNALLEETGAKTAVVTTDGFRDILEIGEAYRDAQLLYNPCGHRDPPLVPRKHRYGVPERLNANGTVTQPLDEDAATDLISTLNDEDFESVAVCFLHSYVNPVHEVAFCELLTKQLPGISISRSSRVSPEIQEYRRTATTVVDAYVKPVMEAYLDTLHQTLTAKGVDVPINVMKSDGGVSRPSLVLQNPISQVISGPVAATKAAQFLGELGGITDIITLDIGGTSADTALITNGAPLEEQYHQLRSMKLNGPFVKINTIGAGGGSIAYVTNEKELRVGPQSAGANPGPVCYGQGGTTPTVTDADLVLGLLNPSTFADGQITLDKAAAKTSITTEIADPLELTLEEAALEIKKVVNSKLAGALRVSSVEEGYDPQDFTLMGFGGAGPVHACTVAALLGTDNVVFPANPGLTSAFGNLASDIQYNFTRSIVTTITEADPSVLSDTAHQLVEDGTAKLDASGVPPEHREFKIAVDAKYERQNHYLTIPVQKNSQTELFTPEVLTSVATEFRQAHQTRYGFTDDDHPIEIGTIRVTAIGHLPPPSPPDTSSAVNSLDQAQTGTRTVTIDRETQADTPTYEWITLPKNQKLTGPSIIELSNSTIWIPPGFEGVLDHSLNLRVTRTEDT